MLLDVRQPNEWADGVVPDSELIFVADLPARIAELPAGAPVTVFCRTGHRASMAASMLDNAGFDVTLVGEGGAADWPAPLEPVPPTIRREGRPGTVSGPRLARSWLIVAWSPTRRRAPTTRPTRGDLARRHRVRPAASRSRASVAILAATALIVVDQLGWLAAGGVQASRT